MQLTKEQFSALAWELRAVSIFFDKPLELRSGDQIESVGNGLGGLSYTFLARSADCVLGCGACCENTFRTAWFWYESEAKYVPDLPSISPLDVEVNGTQTRFFVHRQENMKSCDFLTDDKLCGIHLTGKPLHCAMYPQVWVYPHGGRLWLSRRLPPRNWRWPKCPVPVWDLRADDASHAENLRILDHLLQFCVSSGDTAATERAREAYGWVQSRPRLDKLPNSIPFPLTPELLRTPKYEILELPVI